MSIKYSGNAKLLTFAANREGHYYASMNHDFAKNHEEDAFVLILDVLEQNGWILKTQYDAFSKSEKGFTASETSKDVFIFAKRSGRAAEANENVLQSVRFE